MFIFLVIISALGFALQYAFITKFVRSWDALSMSAYRSLSLWLSLLPLLLFTTQANILAVLDYQVELISAAIAAWFSVWLYFYSMKSLPLGVSYSIRYLTSVLASLVISWFLFYESISLTTFGFISLGLAWGIYLSIFKVNFTHLESKWFYTAICWAIISGFMLSLGLMLMSKVARELDPFVAWYFWELEAAIVFVIMLLLRWIFTWQKVEKISGKDFGKILLACSPTIVGTWGFALAVLYGPAWVASALSVVGVIFTTIIATLFFKEHLKLYQYIAILVIIIGIFGIKISL